MRDYTDSEHRNWLSAQLELAVTTDDQGLASKIFYDFSHNSRAIREVRGSMIGEALEMVAAEDPERARLLRSYVSRSARPPS